MSKPIKPIVVVSKCLGFAHCRYNGLVISDDFVDALQDHVEFHPICPEVEIELGVPRDPVRIVSVDGERKLLQPATGADLTDKMAGFVDRFLAALPEVDGFILKCRSPSCGLKDVKAYPEIAKSNVIVKGSGIFGAGVLARFSHLAVEDEGRLKNFRIREHFLTRLFTMARFRSVKALNAMKELVRFQSENKLLLMAYNQQKMRSLGRIVANHEKRPFQEVAADYEEHLSQAFSRTPRYTSNINVLMHAMGYFSDELTADEKAFFLDSLERYRSGRIPLSVNIGLVKSWVVRFQEEYLLQQTFLEPYPEDLVEITDSGKGRDL